MALQIDDLKAGDILLGEDELGDPYSVIVHKKGPVLLFSLLLCDGAGLDRAGNILIPESIEYRTKWLEERKFKKIGNIKTLGHVLEKHLKEKK